MRRALAIAAAVVRGLVVRFTWIPVHQKCPFCGHWRGGILYDHDRHQIVRRCKTCGGLAAETPLSGPLPPRNPNA